MYIYEIKLGTSTVSYTVSLILYVCIVFYKHVYVFSVFVGDSKLLFVHLIIYSLARTVSIHFYYHFEYLHDGGGHMYEVITLYIVVIISMDNRDVL